MVGSWGILGGGPGSWVTASQGAGVELSGGRSQSSQATCVMTFWGSQNKECPGQVKELPLVPLCLSALPFGEGAVLCHLGPYLPCHSILGGGRECRRGRGVCSDGTHPLPSLHLLRAFSSQTRLSRLHFILLRSPSLWGHSYFTGEGLNRCWDSERDLPKVSGP